MKANEALQEILKHGPCPHWSLNTSLGNGKIWAKCEDCGRTIQQESIPALTEEYDRFIEASDILSKAIEELP
tara:strand:- start:29784 stop:29999 length:216 start_codon:yes stop_codon:yes gene_type:complete